MLTLLLPVPRLVAPAQRDTNLWFFHDLEMENPIRLDICWFSMVFRPLMDKENLLLELSVVLPFHIKKVKKVPFKSPVKIEIRGSLSSMSIGIFPK